MSVYPFICRVCGARDEVVAPVGSDVEHPPCPAAVAAAEEHGLMARDYSSFRPIPSLLATRTGAADVIATNAREKRWSEDLPAYKRLRREGLRPRGTDGAAFHERHANTKIELEHGIDSPPAIAERAGYDVELEGSSR